MARVLLLPRGQAEPLAVELETRADRDGAIRFTLSNGQETVSGTAALDAGSEGRLRVGPRVIPFYTARCGGELHLWLAGEEYRFELPAGGRSAGPGGGALPAGGEIAAPMPGKVIRVLVREGDAVEAQAPLLILESMKMELTVPAPAAGRVAALACKPGSMVDRGTILARLEP